MALKDEYFTISEAAKEIGVTRQTISRWVRDGILPTEKLGRAVLIRKDVFHQHSNKRLLEVKRKSLEGQLINYVREQFKYAVDDEILFIGFDLGYWCFSVKLGSGKYERVRVVLGKPETLTREKGESFIYDGVKYEIVGEGRIV